MLATAAEIRWQGANPKHGACARAFGHGTIMAAPLVYLIWETEVGWEACHKRRDSFSGSKTPLARSGQQYHQCHVLFWKCPCKSCGLALPFFRIGSVLSVIKPSLLGFLLSKWANAVTAVFWGLQWANYRRVCNYIIVIWWGRR